MLDHIEVVSGRLVLIEDPSRFARSLIAQELGVLVMQEHGVQAATAGGDNLTQTDDPSRIMTRRVVGAFAEYDRARLVHTLKAARDRKSVEKGQRVERATPTATPMSWIQRGCCGPTA